MAEFIRGTTPSFSVTLGDGVRFSELGTVIFRFSQFGLHVDKHPTISEDGLTAVCALTQDETLRFREGVCRFQMMGILGAAAVEVVPKSEIIEIAVKPSLWKEAVHNA
jgi:hypothetical protein